MDILNTNAVDLHKAFINGEVSATEIVKAYVDNKNKREPEINAFISDNEKVLEEARFLDEKLAKKENLGILAGIPYSAKDNMMTVGIRTTCASRMLEDYIPTYDATVITLLKNEDALLIGKNNMDEFAVGGSSETSYFKPVHNPLDTSRVPGGSSGGCAAAVSAREASFAVGTDTGGSVRQPSSFCGVVGIKPSYGMVSRYGVQSMAHSLDQVGVIAKDVRDVFYAYKAIAKKDEKDGESRAKDIFKDEDFTKSKEEYIEKARERMKNIRIAKPVEFFTSDLNSDVREKIEEAIGNLEKMGAIVEEIKIPHLNYALPAYYTIAPSELSTDLARFDGVRMGYRTPEYENMIDMMKKTRAEGFGDEVKRRILLGTLCTRGGFEVNYYRKALEARALIVKDLKEVFEKFDYIISPTAPTLPYKLGGQVNNPMEMYLADVYTVPVNLAGICAISVPVGEVSQFSVGCQIMAGRFKDLKLFDIAMALEGGR